MSQSLKEFIPKKEKSVRKQIAIDGETYNLLSELAEHHGLSLAATVKALAMYYNRTQPPE